MVNLLMYECSSDFFITSINSFLKSVIGKDLTKVTMPVHFNEPLSFLQVIHQDTEY